MKKIIALGITAAAVAASLPLTVKAEDTSFYKRLNKNSIVVEQNCDLKDKNSILEQLGINGTLNWNDNCIIIPQLPGSGEQEKPELPEHEGEIENPTEEEEDTTNLSYAEQVVKLVNVERAKEGLPALTIDRQVESAALIRAKEIEQSFSHTRPNGSDFSTVLKENGISYIGAGENIAWGQKSPQEVVEGWLNSPSHRANIMNKNYTSIGVGHYKNTSGTQYWVQLFTY